MRDDIVVERLAADGLSGQTWGFQADMPNGYEVRQGKRPELVLISYQAVSRPTKRHKWRRDVGRLWGRHYEGQSQAVMSWKDVTDDYTWANRDLRWNRRDATPPPPPPADVIEEVMPMVTPKLILPGL